MHWQVSVTSNGWWLFQPGGWGMVVISSIVGVDIFFYTFFPGFKLSTILEVSRAWSGVPRACVHVLTMIIYWHLVTTGALHLWEWDSHNYST